MTSGTSMMPAAVSPDRVRVAVVADHGLVAESVRAALASRGYDAMLVRWPAATEGEGEGGSRSRRGRRPRRTVGRPPDVGLLLSDLTTTQLVGAARSLVAGLGVPWLVLAGVPKGPAWGALYESGASLVVSSRTRLDATCGLLDELAAGRTPRQRRHRHELIRAWRSFARHRDELTVRLGSLTDREEQVLELLHDGRTVREIGEQANVTESTVRSQVKAILRKLGVTSQIAAVAAYEEVQADATDEGSTSQSP